MPAPELASPYALQQVSLANGTTDLSGGTFPASGIFISAGVCRISVALDTATTLACRFAPTGGSATNFLLFGGQSLGVNVPSTCILKVPDGVSFTFRSGAACNVLFMVVEQVFGGLI